MNEIVISRKQLVWMQDVAGHDGHTHVDVPSKT